MKFKNTLEVKREQSDAVYINTNIQVMRQIPDKIEWHIATEWRHAQELFVCYPSTWKKLAKDIPISVRNEVLSTPNIDKLRDRFLQSHNGDGAFSPDRLMIYNDKGVLVYCDTNEKVDLQTIEL